MAVKQSVLVAEEKRQIRFMQFASLLEGTTLITLLFIAMPIKYMAGYPIATTIVGSIHGMAFLFYSWVLVQTVSGGGWTGMEITRLIVGAFIPFGGFVNERFLKRKHDALTVPA